MSINSNENCVKDVESVNVTPSCDKIDTSENKDNPIASENKCTICLGPFENMSSTGICIHKFCFTCLLEWTKIRHACPLCKIKFESIIHTIKSNENFDTYILPPLKLQSSDWTIEISRQEMALFLEGIKNCSRSHSKNPQDLQAFIRSSGTSAFRYLWSRSRGTATSAFRHNIYYHNLFVDESSTVDSRNRVKECSPNWYRNNPAQTHNLVPWLDRELNALIEFDAHLIPRVIDLVVELIQLFNIQDKKFYEQMLRHIGEKTKHFQHEFYHFARSTYDIMEYDLSVRYTDICPWAESSNR